MTADDSSRIRALRLSNLEAEQLREALSDVSAALRVVFPPEGSGADSVFRLPDWKQWTETQRQAYETLRRFAETDW
jgi:hypothetical protein